jgi:hypothetical protein
MYTLWGYHLCGSDGCCVIFGLNSSTAFDLSSRFCVVCAMERMMD